MGFSLYQKILESNLINFIIMVSILTLIFKKANLGSIIDKMADDIRNSVSSSAEAAQAALKEYKEAKRSTKNLPKEKDEILSKAKDGALNIENAAKEFILKEEAELNKKLETQIGLDNNKAKTKAADEILETIMQRAKVQIEDRMKNDDGTIQQRLIERCIEKIDTLEGLEL